jgi:hypothetical protein
MTERKPYNEGAIAQGPAHAPILHALYHDGQPVKWDPNGDVCRFLPGEAGWGIPAFRNVNPIQKKVQKDLNLFFFHCSDASTFFLTARIWRCYSGFTDRPAGL